MYRLQLPEQGSFEQYQYRVGREGVADTQQLWLGLRQQMAYEPQAQALLWVFVHRCTREQQEGLLQLHVKKKLLVVLLSRGEAKLKVSMNFNACMHCHKFLKGHLSPDARWYIDGNPASSCQMCCFLLAGSRRRTRPLSFVAGLNRLF